MSDQEVSPHQTTALEELLPIPEITGASSEVVARAETILFAIDNLGHTGPVEQPDESESGVDGFSSLHQEYRPDSEMFEMDISLNPIKLLVVHRRQLRAMDELEAQAQSFAIQGGGRGLIDALNNLNLLDTNAVAVKIEESKQHEREMVDHLLEIAEACAQTVVDRHHATFVGDPNYNHEQASATFQAQSLLETLTAYRGVVAFARELPDDVAFSIPSLLSVNIRRGGYTNPAQEIIDSAVKQVISPPKLGYGLEAFLLSKSEPRKGSAGYERAQKYNPNYGVDAMESIRQIHVLAEKLGLDSEQFIKDHAVQIAGELSVAHGSYAEALDCLVDTVDEDQRSEILLAAHRALLEERRSVGLDRSRFYVKLAGSKSLEDLDSSGARELIVRQLDIVTRFEKLGSNDVYAELIESAAKDMLDELEIMGADIDAPGLSIEDVLAVREFANQLPAELRISLVSNALHKLDDKEVPTSEDGEAFNYVRKLHKERVITYDDEGNLSAETVQDLRRVTELIDGASDSGSRELMAFLFADLLSYINQTGVDVSQFTESKHILRNYNEIQDVVNKASEDKKILIEQIKEGEETVLQKVRDYVVEHDGIVPEEIDAEIERMESSIGFSINLSVEALTSMLFDAAGNSYASSWDLGYRGAAYALIRDMVEERMSIRLRSRLLAVPQVVYAGVTSNNGKDQVLGSAPGGYGRAWISLKREEIDDRTIVVPQDSFFGPTRNLRGTPKVAAPLFAAINNLNNGKYVEAQIFGGITVADIEAIHIPEEDATPQLVQAIKSQYPDIELDIILRNQTKRAERSKKKSVRNNADLSELI